MLRFQSVSARPTISDQADLTEIMIMTPDGLKKAQFELVKDKTVGDIEDRVSTLEDGVLAVTAPWPYERRITLAGQVTGFVDIDGTRDVTLTTTVPDGALSTSAVNGLSASLLGLQFDIDDVTYRVAGVEIDLAGKLDVGATAVAAQKLAIPRTINGVPFDGTQDIVLDSGDKSYRHDQMTPSDSWLVTHNLNKFPSVAVQDSAGTNVTGAVEYISANQLRIGFAGAMSGTAYLN